MLLKNNNKLFCQNFFCVSEGVPLNTLKLFSANYFWTNLTCFNALILLQKCNFYCKAPKNPHAFFILTRKSFSVFNRAPSHTHWKFFLAKYFIIIIWCPWKVSILLIQKPNFNNTHMLSQNIIYFCKLFQNPGGVPWAWHT